jgi:tRNA(Ile)-lysidine synthase
VPLAAGWALAASALAPPPEDPHAEPATAWLDAAALAFPLVVRPRLPGDTVAPLGMGGRRRKIADLMVDAKIPPRLRARWPLVVSGDQVVWVPLLAVAHPARITAATTVAVSLSLRRNA